MVTDPEIAGTLQAETNPQKAAERLIAIANENGGADNISVIVISPGKRIQRMAFLAAPRGAQTRELKRLGERTLKCPNSASCSKVKPSQKCHWQPPGYDRPVAG